MVCNIYPAYYSHQLLVIASMLPLLSIQSIFTVTVVPREWEVMLKEEDLFATSCMVSGFSDLVILPASGKLLHERCPMDCDGILWRGERCRSDKGNRSASGREVHSICVL